MLRSCSSFWTASALAAATLSAVLLVRVTLTVLPATPSRATLMNPVAASASSIERPRWPRRLADRRPSQYIDRHRPRVGAPGADRHRHVRRQHPPRVEDGVPRVRPGHRDQLRELLRPTVRDEHVGRALALERVRLVRRVEVHAV